MQNKKLPLSQTRTFSAFFLDYLEQKNNLNPFYKRFPVIGNFEEQITEKASRFTAHQREILTTAIEKQYQHIDAPAQVQDNISSLREPKTFTVTTGHQLNIFTGPLYFVYKIVTAINACRELKSRYPDYNFVPVYWMASEDHDYDEIKYFRLYGKKYVWETAQQGAVGRFRTDDMRGLIDEIPGDIAIFRDAYLRHQSLSDAVRYYVNALFGEDGLVVIDPDDRQLKGLFTKVMKDDIVQGSTLPVVEKTNLALEEVGYKPQVHCRPVNFFYLDEHVRSRIEKKDGEFHVVDTSLRFSEGEMKTMIEESPEKLSPNVILRPVYQECILPNLAYIGGPAEVTYWLQLKGIFDLHDIPFPMVMPRNFGLVMESHVFHKFEKTGLDIALLFEEKNYIFNHWILNNTKHDLTTGQERVTVTAIFEQLRSRATSIDSTLGPFVAAEGKRARNILEKIERKLLRAEKRLQSDKLGQIAFVKDALFPNGNLQERTDNLLNFYQHDKRFVARLLEHFDPFDFSFNILIYSRP